MQRFNRNPTSQNAASKPGSAGKRKNQAYPFEKENLGIFTKKKYEN